ncbi:MAG: DNA polymerase III subunit delta [Betaproteobacteria bacterium]|nr:DNA polymerase III subunit delta [Betaproteobacteria bacterium]
MQIPGKDLSAHLARELLPVYVLYGDEPLLVLEAADAIRARARASGFDERETLTALSGFDWGQLARAAGNFSLFGGKKMLDLLIPTGKPGREGAAALQAYCQRDLSDSLLLVTLPQLDWKSEKAVWLTALGEAGAIVKLNAPALAQLPAWIAGRLSANGQSAEPEALAFLCERIEGNLLAAHQELQKLALLYPPGKLGLEEIRNAVLNVARYDLDALREALLVGDAARLARTIEGLRQEGEAPPLVLWAVTEEVRALLQIKLGQEQGKPQESLMREARVWGARQATMKQALHRIKTQTARAALIRAAQIDRIAKGLLPGDFWNEVLRLGLSLSA